MLNTDQVLWEGSVSSDYKNTYLGIGLATLMFSIIGEIIFILILRGSEGESIIFKIVISFLIICCFLSTFTGFMILNPFIFNLLSKYIVTTNCLIIKKKRLLKGERIKSLQLKKVKIIYYVERMSFESNTFHFLVKSIDEVLDPPLTERETEYNAFAHGDLEFKCVDSPMELMKVLESLIPLKKHPDFKNVYVRVE
ncbi:MAG: hypothetical protein ACFFD2_04240 [Promethearchaeota archaeon]